jgi:hypothetical protein
MTKIEILVVDFFQRQQKENTNTHTQDFLFELKKPATISKQHSQTKLTSTSSNLLSPKSDTGKAMKEKGKKLDHLTILLKKYI